MRKKLQRFQDNAKNPMFLEPGKLLLNNLKGNWHHFFNNTNPISLELGCGTGAYTTSLGEKYPNTNLIGIDIKGARMWIGSQEAKEKQLTNVAFLRVRIETLANYFAQQEIATIYMPFPDPRPKERDAKRRLTSPRFLALYQKIMLPGGYLHLKTDDLSLYQFTLATAPKLDYAIIEHTEDLHASNRPSIHTDIETVYEKKFRHQGTAIKYVCLQTPTSPSR